MKDIDQPIPHSRPLLGREEAAAAAAVVASGRLAQGEQVRRFEQAVAAMHGASGAVAVSSGTAALHLTLLALGIGAGDEVILPAYTCSAISNAVRYTGATPVTADVDPGSANLTAGEVKKNLSARSRAIIIPHMFGLPAAMESLAGLGVPIIEDCAQALGAVRRGQRVGGFGTAAVFSFYATKMIATGEGGMVISSSDGLLERIRELRQYDNRDDHRLRYNYKMTDLQAAVGRVQLKRLDHFVKRRRWIADRYFREFEKLEVGLPPRNDGRVYYRFVIDGGNDAERFIQALRQHRILAARPVYRVSNPDVCVDTHPVSFRLWQRNLSIPLYPALSDEQVQHIVSAAGNCFPGKSH